ncbi:hypothetical protein [Cytobacillus gottheilii]|nr:hypothetical protein [Cytobacillus gottheilii]
MKKPKVQAAMSLDMELCTNCFANWAYDSRKDEREPKEMGKAN